MFWCTFFYIFVAVVYTKDLLVATGKKQSPDMFLVVICLVLREPVDPVRQGDRVGGLGSKTWGRTR